MLDDGVCIVLVFEISLVSGAKAIQLTQVLYVVCAVGIELPYSVCR